MTQILEQLAHYENFKSWTFERPSELEGESRPVYPMPAEGPWVGEPDKVQWIDPTTGYDCLILRNRMGALCGYVGVPPEHPWFNKDYNECLDQCGKGWCEHSPESKLSVHGGLTFAGACQPGEPLEGICHVAAPGRPEVWWFGFDCAHAFDLAPGMAEWERRQGFPPMLGEGRDVYRDLDYAVTEVMGLALQLKGTQ